MEAAGHAGSAVRVRSLCWRHAVATVKERYPRPQNALSTHKTTPPPHRTVSFTSLAAYAPLAGPPVLHVPVPRNWLEAGPRSNHLLDARCKLDPRLACSRMAMVMRAITRGAGKRRAMATCGTPTHAQQPHFWSSSSNSSRGNHAPFTHLASASAGRGTRCRTRRPRMTSDETSAGRRTGPCKEMAGENEREARRWLRLNWLITDPTQMLRGGGGAMASANS